LLDIRDTQKGGYMARKKKKTRLQKFAKKRMDTWKKGGMHSRTKHGPVVKNQKQAIAIMLSEAREKGMAVPNNPKKKWYKKQKRG
jgi:hypothetical protein